MAMNLASAGGGRRRGARFRPMAEINVTPFVDVMLVLLIVFIVSAPLLTVGEPVDLPKTESKALPSETAPLAVTVTSAGAVYLGGQEGDEEIPLDELTEKLNSIAAARGQDAEAIRIFIRGDQAADYGAVVSVMARIRAAGFTNLGLVTSHLDQ